MLLFTDQKINAVESHAAVVAYDAAPAVGIRQTCDDFTVTGLLHLGGVCVEYALIVCAAVFRKNLVQLRVWLIAISAAGFLCHLDSAVWHKGAL